MEKISASKEPVIEKLKVEMVKPDKSKFLKK